MAEKARSIDVSSLDELVRIRRDEDVLRDRLEKMEARKDKVTSLVYRRVHEDYETRMAALESEARAPRERAGQEYAKLRAARAEAERLVEDARLQKEELEFRHELGEFPDEQFRARLAECQRLLAERQADLDELVRVKERFLQAFHSEEDLERATPTMGPPKPVPPPPPPPIPVMSMDSTRNAAVPVPVPVPRPASMETSRPVSAPAPVAAPYITSPRAADASPDATVAGYVPAPPPRPGSTGSMPVPSAATVPAPQVPAESEGATLMMALPRFLIHHEDREEEYVLKRENASIGRAPECKIQLPYRDVSRQHANVVWEAGKYKIVDRGSENGIYVNGERVTEHVLMDGDIILIGRRKLVYKT